MKIKVCGMKFPENIAELNKLEIDMMGLIFYPSSPRFAGNINPEIIGTTPDTIQIVGVFVNEEPEKIMEMVELYHLKFVQLHGKESPHLCTYLKNKGCKVIKAFSIAGRADLENTQNYESVCNYFLFDTKTPNYGGSGKQFDWNILNDYTGNIPFLLSGGIGLKDVERISLFDHPLLYAVDLNSCFEITPGLKNIELLNQFVKLIHK